MLMPPFPPFNFVPTISPFANFPPVHVNRIPTTLQDFSGFFNPPSQHNGPVNPFQPVQPIFRIPPYIQALPGGVFGQHTAFIQSPGLGQPAITPPTADTTTPSPLPDTTIAVEQSTISVPTSSHSPVVPMSKFPVDDEEQDVQQLWNDVVV
jgi:hypothetical protein